MQAYAGAAGRRLVHTKIDIEVVKTLNFSCNLLQLRAQLLPSVLKSTKTTLLLAAVNAEDEERELEREANARSQRGRKRKRN